MQTCCVFKPIFKTNLHDMTFDTSWKTLLTNTKKKAYKQNKAMKSNCSPNGTIANSILEMGELKLGAANFMHCIVQVLGFVDYKATF